MYILSIFTSRRFNCILLPIAFCLTSCFHQITKEEGLERINSFQDDSFVYTSGEITTTTSISHEGQVPSNYASVYPVGKNTTRETIAGASSCLNYKISLSLSDISLSNLGLTWDDIAYSTDGNNLKIVVTMKDRYEDFSGLLISGQEFQAFDSHGFLYSDHTSVSISRSPYYSINISLEVFITWNS